MALKKIYSEAQLAALAKRFRKESGKTKAQMGRELGVGRATMQDAEENPRRSLTKVRIRIIESCSPYAVRGPVFWLEKK